MDLTAPRDAAALRESTPTRPPAKLCHKCGCSRPANKKFFRGDKGRADGLESWCKECRAKNTKRRKRSGATAAPTAAPVPAARETTDPADPHDFEIDIDNIDFDNIDFDIEVGAEETKVERKRSGAAAPRLRRILWIPDVHIPYEDKRAFELLLEFARAWRPELIVILGDFADFYSASSHSKDPRRTRLLDEEIRCVNERLTQLDALGAKEKIYIEGNHEDRLNRYLSDKAPELSGLLTVRDQFKLSERDWKFVPYKSSIRVGKIFVTHDVGNAGPQAHVKAVTAFQDNIIIGHTHRMAMHYESNAQGDAHVGASFGWLGDKAAIDYMHENNVTRAWQLGFGIGYQEDGGVVHLQAIPIIATKESYRCVVEGVRYG